MNGESSLPPSAFDAEAQEVAMVNLLGKDYQIKSDRADLVKKIADRVNQEGQKVLASSPSGSQFDVAAQVAFRLAVALNTAEQNLANYKRQVESQAESLARKLDEGF